MVRFLIAFAILIAILNSASVTYERRCVADGEHFPDYGGEDRDRKHDRDACKTRTYSSVENNQKKKEVGLIEARMWRVCSYKFSRARFLAIKDQAGGQGRTDRSTNPSQKEGASKHLIKVDKYIIAGGYMTAI